MEDRNHYIEFRVYLKKEASGDVVHEAAEVLQDALGDSVSCDNAPDIFTQDVTFTVVRVGTLAELIGQVKGEGVH